MAIQINLSNKTAYTIIAIALVLIIGGVVIAFDYSINIPNPGHGADTVLVNVPGIGEKNLQAAIIDGDFSGGSGDITGVIAGTGLSGGGESGGVTLSLKNPTTSQIGGVKSKTCPTNQAITSIDSSGNPQCGYAQPPGVWVNLAYNEEYDNTCTDICAKAGRNSAAEPGTGYICNHAGDRVVWIQVKWMCQLGYNGIGGYNSPLRDCYCV